MDDSNNRARVGVDDSDEGDRRLFAPLGPRSVEEILEVKRGYRNTLYLHFSSGRRLDEASLRHLGDIIGQSPQLSRIHLCGDYEHPIDMTGLCAGTQHNTSIEEINFDRVDLSAVKMSSLAPFLTNNPRLCRITLRRGGIGSEGIEILSNALAGRTVDTLEMLNLDGNQIGHLNLNPMVGILRRSRNLVRLGFSTCGIGQNACISLATLLEDQDSSVHHLNLRCNPIDGQCAEILARALSNNTKLKKLDLTGNPSAAKWVLKAFLNLVCDWTSIRSIVASNHTLDFLQYRVVGGPSMQWEGSMSHVIVCALGAHDGSLLCGSLKLNKERDTGLVVRCKILWGQAKGVIKVGDSLPVVLGNSPEVIIAKIPPILSCFGNAPNEAITMLLRNYDARLTEPRVATMKLDCVYGILRSWPDLFFPEEPRARAE